MRSALALSIGLLALVLGLRTFVALGWLLPLAVQGASMQPHFRPGERLLVDRTTSPQRWDAVLLRSPVDAHQLWVKRLVGMPGENVRLLEGDLWIDDERVIKPWPAQQQLRLPIHRPTWQPAGGTQPVASEWKLPEGGSLGLVDPVYDDLPENTQVSRRLNRVHDLMVALHYAGTQGAELQVQIAGATYLAPAEGEGTLVLSTFDRQLLVLKDQQEIDRRAILDRSIEENRSPVSIRATRGAVHLSVLRLYRDLYYEASPAAPERYQLGPNEYFVLGDNPAVSVDSRNWEAAPGLPHRLLVGRVTKEMRP